MEPLLENAFSHKAITAWVCANDAMASFALLFLRTKKTAVPKFLSITGFDDDIEMAFKDMITSYNFNMPAGVAQMIDYLLHPRQRLFDRTGPDKNIEIKGYIVERRTSGRAKSSG
jgi:DNA-binding LacI/PurR family transcriptional regulator